MLQSTLIQHESRQPLFDMVINPKSFTQVRLDVQPTSFDWQSRAKPYLLAVAVVVCNCIALQTVENLFDTSFLVRNNSAEIGVDEDTGLPYLSKGSGVF